ncbi:IS3 family transposase [Pectinatus frisingensis]
MKYFKRWNYVNWYNRCRIHLLSNCLTLVQYREIALDISNLYLGIIIICL